MIKRSELNGFGSKTAEERFAGIVGSIKSEQKGDGYCAGQGNGGVLWDTGRPIRPI